MVAVVRRFACPEAASRGIGTWAESDHIVSQQHRSPSRSAKAAGTFEKAIPHEKAIPQKQLIEPAVFAMYASDSVATGKAYDTLIRDRPTQKKPTTYRQDYALVQSFEIGSRLDPGHTPVEQ